MKCVNIKLWNILGCFHYILNTPRIKPPCDGTDNQGSLLSLLVMVRVLKRHYKDSL